MSETIDPTTLAALVNLAPRRLNLFLTTGWIDSVARRRPVNALGEPTPWFTHPAIDFLEQRVNPNWKVLEWGSGNSTLWWATRVAQVTSVENNPQWHQELSNTAPANAKIHLIENLQDYPSLKGIDAGGPFDMIVIDGEERTACAAKSHELAGPSTMIVLDNSDRISLRPAMEFLRAKSWKRIDFYGLLPCYAYRTCTSVYYRGDLPAGTDALPCDFVSCLGPTMSQTLRE